MQGATGWVTLDFANLTIEVAKQHSSQNCADSASKTQAVMLSTVAAKSVQDVVRFHERWLGEVSIGGTLRGP